LVANNNKSKKGKPKGRLKDIVKKSRGYKKDYTNKHEKGDRKIRIVKKKITIHRKIKDKDKKYIEKKETIGEKILLESNKPEHKRLTDKKQWSEKQSQIKTNKEEAFWREKDKEGDISKITSAIKKKKREKSQPVVPKSIEIPDSITVGDLAKKLQVKASEVIVKLMNMGVMATINDVIDSDTASLVAYEFGAEVKVVSIYDEVKVEDTEEDRPEDMKPRPPIVTIMGHVDHGKTKLLDAIRESNIAEKETGGITQHIGAYKVRVNKGEIVFLDTPGHEAFTSLRARGAMVTDIVVLVVAADDGVMPQTVEAINHAREANVPIIVAINKIDLPNANPDKVKNELTKYELIPEEWGGDTLFVEISAKRKINIDKLLDAILLQAEILELKANPNRKAECVVIESRLDPGRGPVATVIVQRGTLRVGDPFVVGVESGKVRAMFDDSGHKVKEALPSDPVEILGFEEVPEAGEKLQVVSSEKYAKEIASKRRALKKMEALKSMKKVTLDDINKMIQEGSLKELKIVLKADTQGSIEAITNSINKMSFKNIRISIIHSGIGSIKESDVLLASASNAIIIGFRVRPTQKAKELIEREKVDMRIYSIIYQIEDDIKKAIEGLLEPTEEEKLVGTAEVKQVFRISKVGVVAGCYVKSGKVIVKAIAKLVRDGTEIYKGRIESLRRFKEDVKEVKEGYECGIKLEGYSDIKENDMIECYEIVKIKQTL
jgi:translation initiation factor IF-2